MSERTKSHVDPSTLTITFQRTLAAPPDEVFDAWTDPEAMRAWWDPTGTPLAACTIDARAGGKFEFTMSSGHAPPFAGVYRVVDRPTRIVFDAMGAVGTVRLEAAGATTNMTVTIRCASAEHLAKFLELGVAEGTDRTLDNLVARIARRTR